MNQIMLVGKGVLVATENRMTADSQRHFTEMWREQMPGIPMIVISEAQFVLEGEIGLFEFTGDVSPTMVAEFQLWWEEVSSGDATTYQGDPRRTPRDIASRSRSESSRPNVRMGIEPIKSRTSALRAELPPADTSMAPIQSIPSGS